MRVPPDDRPAPSASAHSGPGRSERRPAKGPAPEVLDALIDSAPVGIGFFSADLRYLRVNDALARLNGSPPEAHHGRTPEEVMGEMGREVMSCLRKAVVTRRPVVEQEISGRVRGLGGRVQHREGSWFPVFDDSGTVIGIGGVARDVSRRHQLELERLRLLETAITARAHAEAAQVRSATMQEEAEIARREAEAARREAEHAERAMHDAHERMRFLMDAGAHVRHSLDVSDAVDRLAAVAVPVLADVCYITTADSTGTLQTRAIAHVDPESMPLARELIERYPPRVDDVGGPGRVIGAGEPELIPRVGDRALDVYAQDERHRELLAALGIQSSLVLPLRTRDRTLGALTLLMTDSGRRFSTDDVAFARALVDQASLHLQTAQLYTESAHIARTLQSSLLPRELPEVPGFEIAARYLAAGPQNEVGGDFYDVFGGDDHAWTVLLGDVAGKGAEAAAVTSLARHTLRTAAQYDASPARNLLTLNRALIAERSTTRFCTVLCARVRPWADHATITFANGGHLAPRIVRADGTHERVQVAGTLVGSIPGARFQELALRLDRGDLVVMFTDGVTEVRSPGRDVDSGERELDLVLGSLAGASAEEVVSAVERRALELHEGRPRDDMAIVALHVVGR